MITQALAMIFYGLVWGLISLLPNPETLPSAVGTAFTAVAPYFEKANYFFPLTTVFQIIALMTALEIGILTFKAFNWIFNKIRGAG